MTKKEIQKEQSTNRATAPLYVKKELAHCIKVAATVQGLTVHTWLKKALAGNKELQKFTEQFKNAEIL